MGFTEGEGHFGRIPVGRFEGVHLLTVDAENVLTPYGDPTVFDEAMTALEGIINLRHAPAVAILTNNRDVNYVHDLAAQMPKQVVGNLPERAVPVLSGLEYPSKKTSSAMFLSARAQLQVHGGNAIHVDDQWLSFRGAKKAHFTTGILVKPYGPNDHNGVKLGRVIDTPLRLALRANDVVQGGYMELVDI